MDRTCAVALASAALSGAAGCWDGAGATAPEQRLPLVHVSCDQVIDRTTRPFSDGYRRVPGAVAAPPAHIPQVVRSADPRWPWWEKAGMVIRAGAVPIGVRVPANWQGRAAITWGNNLPPAREIRFDACPSPAGVWNAYAGGFLLKSRGACVPLVFEVGGERRVVRFGIRVPCGG
jgi:hypothetical protein